jgi:hypothetical protein
MPEPLGSDHAWHAGAACSWPGCLVGGLCASASRTHILRVDAFKATAFKLHSPRFANQASGRLGLSWLVVCVAVAFSLMCNQGLAQTRHNVLRGLSEMDLTIESLSEDAKRCGLTKEAIRAAVMYPLSSTKIALDRDASVTLYINVGTIYQKQGCISSVAVQAYAFQKVTLLFSGDERVVDIILWKSGSLLTSSWNGHVRQVSETIEEEVKKFITDWNLDNRP